MKGISKYHQGETRRVTSYTNGKITMNLEEFYQERIKHFDEERQLFHEYLDLVHISKKEKHMLDWNNRQMHADLKHAQEDLDRSKKNLDRTRTFFTY